MVARGLEMLASGMTYVAVSQWALRAEVKEAIRSGRDVATVEMANRGEAGSPGLMNAGRRRETGKQRMRYNARTGKSVPMSPGTIEATNT